MTLRTALFLIAILLFVSILISVATFYYRRSRRTSDATWEQLLNRMTHVDREGVAQVALDYADESGRRRTTASEALEKNSAVLIDLAAYVQQWYPEAIVLAEELRLNAREIEWHVERLRGAARTGSLETSFADYAQPAVAKYYLMTRRVLALYESGGLPMLTQLQQTI
jgi:hypothetical protein